MKRHQLFEFCDLPWLPTSLRSLTPTFLEAAFRLLGAYQVAVRPLAEALRATGSSRILDLGSGGAGPLPLLLDGLAAQGLSVQATMTDKFPNVAALSTAAQSDPQRLSFLPTSVDATAVPKDLPGLRTMFQLLHHFPPQTAQAILQDAVDKEQGIAIFEVTQRRFLGVVMALLIPFLVLVVTPLIRPLRLGRLLLTYVLPLAPIIIAWDAIVSTLRSYTEPELWQMTRSLHGVPYIWKQGSGRHALTEVTWLIGYPAPELPIPSRPEV
ncbi:MAG: hypothetical protein JNM40_17455 [Myxococcales bacterium]|nr:hypothetical protein [Myxococcales bacterium]